jgi:hypothetical protein
MRKLACVVFLFCAGSAWAQGRDGLVLGGVEIWIGMPEAQVNSALQANSLRRDKDGLVWSTERPPYNVYGQVTTKNGEVNYISRHWLLNETPNSQTGFAAALYAAIASFVGTKGAVGCFLSAQTEEQPTLNSKEIIVKCLGSPLRTLRVGEVRASINGQAHDDAEIQEEIAAP